MDTSVNEVADTFFRQRLYEEDKAKSNTLLMSGLFFISLLLVWLSHKSPFKKHTYEYSSYPIDKQQFKSSATRIFLTRSKNKDERICLKIWQNSKDYFDLYRANSLELCNSYVYNGLRRNRTFVKGVYSGIAPIRIDEDEIRQLSTVQLGKIIEDPSEKDMKDGVQYALVMKYLEEDWRLDYQLSKGGLDTEIGMKFLAKEIAKMHAKEEDAIVKDRGTPADIAEKLNLNLSMLEELLKRPAAQVMARKQEYRDMMEVMREAVGKYHPHFVRRQQNGWVRLCHGDLKTANLWLQSAGRPKDKGFRASLRLFILDCVDFDRPEFCCIDVLSDIAMLAVDIQMYVTDWSNPQKKKGQNLIDIFLKTYLHETKQGVSIAWRLLEYYLVEKAIVFACMSFLYDDLPIYVAERYLDIALLCTQKMKQRLSEADKGRTTSSKTPALTSR